LCESVIFAQMSKLSLVKLIGHDLLDQYISIKSIVYSD